MLGLVKMRNIQKIVKMLKGVISNMQVIWCCSERWGNVMVTPPFYNTLYKINHRLGHKKIGLSQKPARIGMITACQHVGLRAGPKIK